MERPSSRPRCTTCRRRPGAWGEARGEKRRGRGAGGEAGLSPLASQLLKRRVQVDGKSPGSVSEASRKCLGGVSEASRKCLGGVLEASRKCLTCSVTRIDSRCKYCAWRRCLPVDHSLGPSTLHTRSTAPAGRPAPGPCLALFSRTAVESSSSPHAARYSFTKSAYPAATRGGDRARALQPRARRCGARGGCRGVEQRAVEGAQVALEDRVLA